MDEKKLFNVVLVGEIKEGFDKSVVKNNLAVLFKVPLEKAETLLKGQLLVVKGSVDTATAAKYKVAIERAGAVCRLEAVAQEEPLEFDFIKEPSGSKNAAPPPSNTPPPNNRVREAAIEKRQEAPQTSSPSLNEKELNKVIDGLSISEGKKGLFKLIASTPLKGANGVPVFDSNDKRLKPFRTSLTEKDSIWNGWAFLFGYLYWFAKGMWKKGILLAVIQTPTLLILVAIIGTKVQIPVVLGFMMISAAMANYDLYRKLVLKEDFWW